MESSVAMPRDVEEDVRSRKNLEMHRQNLTNILDEADRRSTELRAELEAAEATAGSCRAALSHLEEHDKVRQMPQGHPVAAHQ